MSEQTFDDLSNAEMEDFYEEVTMRDKREAALNGTRSQRAQQLKKDRFAKKIDQVHVGVHLSADKDGEPTREYWITLKCYGDSNDPPEVLMPTFYKKADQAERAAWKIAFHRCGLKARPVLVVTQSGAFTVSTGTYPQRDV